MQPSESWHTPIQGTFWQSFALWWEQKSNIHLKSHCPPPAEHSSSSQFGNKAAHTGKKALALLVPPQSVSAYKSLLAGSWEAAANDSFAAECRKSPFNPACCCLSPWAWQKDRCGQHASRWEDPVKTQQGIWCGPMLAKHHSQKTPFGLGCLLGLIFKQLEDVCTDFFFLYPKNPGKYPKDNFEFAVAALIIPCLPAIQAPWDKRGICKLRKKYTIWATCSQPMK